MRAPAATPETAIPRALAQVLSGPLAMGDNLRPLLDMVIELTGLDCAYLTRVDPARTRQWVVMSQHLGQDGLVIPEGASAAWEDSLCRQALEQGVAYTADAGSLAPTSAAVRALGIHTYTGQPIADGEGRLLGTLCAVSQARVPMRESVPETLSLFARLLAMQVEHDRVVTAARAAFEDQATSAIAGALDAVADRARLHRRLREVFRLNPWD